VCVWGGPQFLSHRLARCLQPTAGGFIVVALGAQPVLPDHLLQFRQLPPEELRGRGGQLELLLASLYAVGEGVEVVGNSKEHMCGFSCGEEPMRGVTLGEKAMRGLHGRI